MHIDLNTAILKVLAVPDNDPDPPIFWLAEASPFVGACAKKAVQDLEAAENLKHKWWEDRNGENSDFEEPKTYFTRYSEGHDECSWTGADNQGSAWYCMCGQKVIHHPHG